MVDATNVVPWKEVSNKKGISIYMISVTYKIVQGFFFLEFDKTVYTAVLSFKLWWMIIQSVQNQNHFRQRKMKGPEVHKRAKPRHGALPWWPSRSSITAAELFQLSIVTIHWSFLSLSTDATFSCSTGKYLIPMRSPTLLITWTICMTFNTWSGDILCTQRMIYKCFHIPWIQINCTLYLELKWKCRNKARRGIDKSVDFTSNPLIRSSLDWEAEIHILALASSSGVAGNATVTTAT